ncbi:MAG TPA: phosphoadenylyl-sulfate reductase [Chitinophagaceae bacterium]
MVELSKELEQASLVEALQIVVKQFPEGVVFSSSFGQEDQVIADTIWRNDLPVKVFTLDTGRLFQETYDLMDITRARYKKDFSVYFPDYKKVEEYVEEHGFNGFYDSVENRKSCCHIRKVEPLNRALQGAKVWITGLRADQSDNRGSMAIWEWDEHRQLYKFNPLIRWSYEEVLEYLRENNVPYNRLHDQGFISIGCAPCTRAIQPGEHPRAGRWWWETSKKECGLHE